MEKSILFFSLVAFSGKLFLAGIKAENQIFKRGEHLPA